MFLCVVLFVNVITINISTAVPWYNNRTFRLPKREGVEVGHNREVKLNLGKTHVLKTLSLKPPIFAVEDFLTSEECEYIIYQAKQAGLKESPTHPEESNFKTTLAVFNEWDINNDSFIEPIEFTYIKGKGDIYLTEYEIMRMMNNLDMDRNDDKKIDFQEFQAITAERIRAYFIALYKNEPYLRSRNSQQAWLWHYGVHSDLIEGFHERISRLTLLPHDLIEMSEPMQVVHYEEGGHYHCHHDSDSIQSTLPCCTYHNQVDGKCRLCRFITIMFYLTNVTLGGETAFQVADNGTFSIENWAGGEADNKCNLADNCHESNLVVKPLRGTAIMWYNHDVDEKSGWLGDLDLTTFHGGCDVMSTDKWISNVWINVIGEKASRDSYEGWLGMRMDEMKSEL